MDTCRNRKVPIVATFFLCTWEREIVNLIVFCKAGVHPVTSMNGYPDFLRLRKAIEELAENDSPIRTGFANLAIQGSPGARSDAVGPLLTSDDAVVLSRALSSPCFAIEALRLTKLGAFFANEQTMKLLGEGLRVNRSVRKLDLSRNNLGRIDGGMLIPSDYFSSPRATVERIRRGSL